MLTKMAGIYASPAQTQCTEGPTRIPTRTPTQVHTQQRPHRSLLQTTPRFRGLSSAAWDTRWMKATSVWVSSLVSQGPVLWGRPHPATMKS